MNYCNGRGVPEISGAFCKCVGCRDKYGGDQCQEVYAGGGFIYGVLGQGLGYFGLSCHARHASRLVYVFAWVPPVGTMLRLEAD